MIDYEKIRQECPDAFKEFLEVMGFSYPLETAYQDNRQDGGGNIQTILSPNELYGAGNTDKPWSQRCLYDYFDSVGIIVEVGKTSDTQRWRYEIWESDNRLFSSESYHDAEPGKPILHSTRTEAETSAFEKAFSIRDQQLKERE